MSKFDEIREAMVDGKLAKDLHHAVTKPKIPPGAWRGLSKHRPMVMDDRPVEPDWTRDDRPSPGKSLDELWEDIQA